MHKTVLKRLKVAKQALHDIRMLMEDKRAQSIGGINVAFKLWRYSVIPMLLYNGDTGVDVLPKTYKVLNDPFL